MTRYIITNEQSALVRKPDKLYASYKGHLTPDGEWSIMGAPLTFSSAESATHYAEAEGCPVGRHEDTENNRLNVIAVEEMARG